MFPFFHNLIVSKVLLLFASECTAIKYYFEVLLLYLSHFTQPKVLDPIIVTIISFLEMVLFFRRDV